MNRIRLLEEQVANQIAAGEVVERPASVVKELVENALDAQATRIQVEIGAGGRSLIRVTDDGVGMTRDDALLCLERHATSKIQRAEDLDSIATMGFRGEAIPSIASVCRFTLTTRERSDTTGEATRITIEGGKIRDVRAAAGPAGTTVEVRQLFFNLPARRKFLRTRETERAHITHYLTLAALAYPEVGFTFLQDTRMVWQLPPVPWSQMEERRTALRERLRQLRGTDVPWVAVDFAAEIESARSGDPDESLEAPVFDSAGHTVRIWGFVGAPGTSRGNRDEQHLFVNRRPVENRGLNFALMEGYHTLLMKGRYPVCCLFLEMDPAAVDVNIHPSKREVKFREEPAVRRLVARAVREALLEFSRPQPERIDGVSSEVRVGDKTPGTTDSFDFANAPGARIQAEAVARSPLPRQGALPMGFRGATPAALPFGEHRENSTPAPPVGVPAATPSSVPAPPSPLAPPGSGATPNSHVSPTPGPAHGLLSTPLRLVGVVGRLYVVLESDRGLVLMDQHAAHERILFEQMLARLQADQRAPSQRLLLPETVELPPRDAQFVRENQATLDRLGVELREFGERTFLLDALPPFVRASVPGQFARELISELQAVGTGVNTLRLGEEMVAKTVCRHAVKANDALAPAELQGLVDSLRHCEMPYTCPHGRPVLIELSWKDLEKRFGRIQ